MGVFRCCNPHGRNVGFSDKWPFTQLPTTTHSVPSQLVNRNCGGYSPKTSRCLLFSSFDPIMKITSNKATYRDRRVWQGSPSQNGTRYFESGHNARWRTLICSNPLLAKLRPDVEVDKALVRGLCRVGEGKKPVLIILHVVVDNGVHRRRNFAAQCFRVEGGKLRLNSFPHGRLSWILGRIERLNFEFALAVIPGRIETELPCESTRTGYLTDGAMLIPIAFKSHLNFALHGVEMSVNQNGVMWCVFSVSY